MTTLRSIIRAPRRVIAFLVVLSALMAVVALVGSRAGDGTAAEALPPRTTVNRIAYVDPDGSISTVMPDGSDVQKISPENGFFTWPVWSPDGGKIAFSGASEGVDGPGPLQMFVYPREGGDLRVVYTNESGTGPINPGVPHYPIWSPDSGRLAFMASESSGLTLRVTKELDHGETELVLRGAPLYTSWSTDSQRLLVHVGSGHSMVEVASGITVHDLGIQSVNYRAPAWRPSGDQFVVVSETESGERRLLMSDLAGNRQTTFMRVLADAAFLWSPDGGTLAVARSDVAGASIYRGVRFFASNGDDQPVRLDEDLIAFFWAPDSARVAYVTLTPDRRALRWNVLDMEDGVGRPLVEFVPSDAQMVLFSFFDQFGHSHAVWSPDSQSLVFAGSLSPGAISVSVGRQQVSNIFVVSTGQYPTVERIAEGFLGVWSPR